MNVCVVCRTSFLHESLIFYYVKRRSFISITCCERLVFFDNSATLLYPHQTYTLLIQGHYSTKHKYGRFYTRIRVNKLFQVSLYYCVYYCLFLCLCFTIKNKIYLLTRPFVLHEHIIGFHSLLTRNCHWHTYPFYFLKRWRVLQSFIATFLGELIEFR